MNEKMACLELTVKKLQSQLLMSADHNLSWRDERLKLSLNELERLIGKTANQIALSGLIPRGLPSRIAISAIELSLKGCTTTLSQPRYVYTPFLSI